MKIKGFFLTLILLMQVVGVYSQEIRITGIVQDKAEQEPLPGAVISVMGKQNVAVSGINGSFALNISPEDKFLEVSFLGMKNETVALSADKKHYIILLEEDFSNLDEVVVVGYGTQKKRDIIGAISSISEDDFDSNAGGSVASSLQGKISGMEIISNSGEPGAGTTISIRGNSSISGSSNPLFIIDGVPMESGNIVSIEGDATFSPLEGLSPNDIESIEVLKDAASAAIYGSRAANGVILITTKGGNQLKVQQPTINISHTSSLVSLSRKLDVMNAAQFREAYAEARMNAGLDYPANQWVVNPYHPYYARTTDWQDVIFDDSYQSSTNLSLSGGSRDYSYGFYFGYRDLKPIVKAHDYKQFTAKGNFSYRLTNRITAATRISYSQQDYDRVITSTSQSSYQSVIRAALYTNPAFAPYDPYTGELKDWLGSGKEQRNPLALLLRVPVNYWRKWTVLNQDIMFNLMEGLDLKVSISEEASQTKQESYRPRIFDSVANPLDVRKYSESKSSKFLTENTLTYRLKKNEHNLNAVLGTSYERSKSESTRLDGKDYLDETIVVIQNAALHTDISQGVQERALLSFFGRISYDWESRYLVSATLRSDGSSRFGKNNRFGYFPSIALGWRFSDEKFMDFSSKILQDGKLRVSLGTTGNQSTGNYAWRGAYSAQVRTYDGNLAVLYSTLSNPNLQWETTQQLNAGLDLSFFRGRIQFIADAYIKHSKDLLYNFPISLYSGFSTYPNNFGKIENRGLEFSMETLNLNKKVFKWRTKFNISLNRNKILELPNNNEDILQTHTSGVEAYSLGRVGHPLGVFYGLQALGVYSTDADNVWKYDEITGEPIPYRLGSPDGYISQAGDMKWKDIDNNGYIDDNDKTIIGSPYPDFVGGLGNTLTYKRFTLNMFFSFSFGNEILNEMRRERNRMFYTNNLGQDALNRWKNPGDITNFPKITYMDPNQNFRPSSFTIEDASFIRLREINLSYSFPSSVAKKLYSKSISIFVSGSNLLTWSKYSGYDPEVNSSTRSFIKGVDNGSFPKSRSYNVGVNISF